MSGDQFQFDESGDAFCCFVVAFLTVTLIPLTYCAWPREESKEPAEGLKKKCQCQPCQQKINFLKSGSTAKTFKRDIIKYALVAAWLFLFFLVYKLSLIEPTVDSFDPFAELSIDKDAPFTEIRKAYKALSLKYHPDKGGDEQKFIRISKAYAALTNEESKKNWLEYGNPDGPTATNFGIALPKWLVEKENAYLVIGVYALAFMLILPLAVGLWWYKTMRYSSSNVLLLTVRLFCGSFMQAPFMEMPRIIKLLSSACEFSHHFNKEIVCRPSDNVELHPLIMQIPIFTIFKKVIVGAPYAVKARALIYAHLLRLDLPPKTLLVDKQYVIKQCPRLLNEMISSLLCVLSIAMEERGSRKKIPQHLVTIESCMHLVPMVVQALSSNMSNLFQLPHIGPAQLRHMITRQRNIKTVRQLAQLPDDKRRLLLRNLSDEQYGDVVNVCAAMPHLEIKHRCEVIDEDDPSIWPLSIVTTTVTLTRRPLLILSAATANLTSANMNSSTDLRSGKDESLYAGSGESSSPSNSNLLYHAAGAGHSCDTVEENIDDIEEELPEDLSETPVKKSSVPVWDKSKRRKGAKKGKQRRQENMRQQQLTAKKNKEKERLAKAEQCADKGDEKDVQDIDGNSGMIDKLSLGEDDTEKANDAASSPGLISENGDEPVVGEADETLIAPSKTSVNSAVQLAQAEAKKRDDKKRNTSNNEVCTHVVHCPFLPTEKYEGWWVYLVDRKSHQLITKPVYLANLQTEEELQLKFMAPPIAATYLYTLCIRSDSYVDFDYFDNVRFVVSPMPEHVIRMVSKAEAQKHDSSSSDEDDEDDEEEEEDDGFADEEVDEEEDVESEGQDDEDEFEEGAGDKVSPRGIDMARLSEYVARS